MKKSCFIVSLAILIIIQTFFIFKLSNEYISVIRVKRSMKEKKTALTMLSNNLSNSNSKKKELAEKIKKAESEKIKLIKENSKLENILFLNKTTSFYVANIPENKVVYLTFDDGPSNNTLKILDILDRYNVKATFFVNGSSSKFSINTYKTIVSKGHSLGNHTYSHNYSEIYKNIEGFIKDFNKLQNHLNNSIGIQPKIARLPGGSNNTVSRKYGGKSIMRDISKYLIDNDYTYFDWNVDSTDASVKLQNKNKIITSVLNRSKNKSAAIVLMHDNSLKTTTVEALPEIIEGLIKQGFEFRPLSSAEYINQFLRAK
ncbi:polysaccharide deacetylase family protein [Clostridium ganghwense]|uniref:Polysaccharide deacetylase n=1 Tax=Clostridium ganghwense TaxID=312089 RepID=A0ABT4CL03_9CLOT|nr:polysaccharide deacetylase family protein [Clostridium ganghwense]MCY6369725.1 polysaccharide deacetylase [Clostridium ganghwense]